MRKYASWRIHALALLLYSLCTVVITFPLITRLGDAFIANEFGQVDGFLSIWNLWWASQAILNTQNPFHTPLLFHPQGLELFWLWLSLPNGMLALPATLLFGPLAAYNLTIIVGYVLGAYAAFLFIRRYCADNLAALLGGACYAFTAFHMRRVLDSVMDTASIQWVPLYLLALHCLLERPRWWLAIVSGLLVLLVGLGSWYYGLFCLLYTGVASLLWAVRAGERASAGVGKFAMPASSVSSSEPGAVHDQRLQLQDGLNQASSACSQKYTQDRSLLVTYPSSLSSAQNTKHKAQNFLSVADICTGSGCIAIALAKYLPQAHIFATDISSEALELAAHNVMRHDVTQQVQLLQGDLLDVLPQAVNLLVSNPPYTMIDSIDEGVRRHEPRLALDGGPDGLELYRRLLAAAPGRINAGGAILLEIGAEQGQAVQMLARAAFPQAEISIHPDLAGHDRVVRILLG